MVNIKNGIYVTLDSLFDTRYGTLIDIDKSLLKKELISDKYWNRLYDEFSYINNLFFSYVYSKRDKITLFKSPPTKIIELIATELVLIESRLIEANEIPILTLTVNTFPYTLSKGEMDSLTKALKILTLNKNLEVAYINVDSKDITLDFIGSNFSIAIMYEYSKWIDYHLVNKTGNATDTVLYVPAITGTPTKVKKERELEDMLQAYSELFGAFIKITHIPIEAFSAKIQEKEKLIKTL